MERVNAIRSTLATSDDCRAIAQRIDDEISALGLHLRTVYPDHAPKIAMALNRARSDVVDTMRAVGIGEEVRP